MKIWIPIFLAVMLAIGLLSGIYLLPTADVAPAPTNTNGSPALRAEPTGTPDHDPFKARLQEQRQGLPPSPAPALHPPGHNPFQAKLEEQQQAVKTSPFAR